MRGQGGAGHIRADRAVVQRRMKVVIRKSTKLIKAVPTVQSGSSCRKAGGWIPARIGADWGERSQAGSLGLAVQLVDLHPVFG